MDEKPTVKDAMRELMGYVNKGYVKAFDGADEACLFVGGALVLSDLLDQTARSETRDT